MTQLTESLQDQNMVPERKRKINRSFFKYFGGDGRYNNRLPVFPSYGWVVLVKFDGQ